MAELVEHAVAVFIGFCIPEVSGGLIEPTFQIGDFEEADARQRERQGARPEEGLYLVRTFVKGDVWLSLEGAYCRVYSESGPKERVKQALRSGLVAFDAVWKPVEAAQVDLSRAAFQLDETDQVNVVLSQRSGEFEGFHMSAFRSRQIQR